MTNIIIKGITRILRPQEYEMLRTGAKILSNKTNLDMCLLLGARYNECVRIQDNPDFFDEGAGYVHITTKKVKVKEKDRWIRLSNLGISTMPHFIENKRRLPRSPQGFLQDIRRWAVCGGLDSTGLSARSLRKTYESWLITCYPHLSSNIYLSQGHTELTSIQHYQGLPFTAEDKSAMQKYVSGWELR